MIDARRLQYLQAMELPVWLLRRQDEAGAGEPARLHIGPGNGSLLLLCSEPGETATPLAADLVRSLSAVPVWGWPDSDGSAGVALAEAVAERLLTGVAVFGMALSQQVFASVAPATLGSARVVVLPALQELLSDPLARRSCWRTLLAAGLTARA